MNRLKQRLAHIKLVEAGTNLLERKFSVLVRHVPLRVMVDLVNGAGFTEHHSRANNNGAGIVDQRANNLARLRCRTSVIFIWFDRTRSGRLSLGRALPEARQSEKEGHEDSSELHTAIMPEPK